MPGSLVGVLVRRPRKAPVARIALLVATAVALAMANGPWHVGWAELWDGTAHTIVNDGLMTVFFFVVGLELKRELVLGELRDRRTALLPAIAALGGMVVPALVYLAIEGGDGWGVPMATDIAFAVGVVALLGPRVPPALRLFLLTLAVVDDIGAIVVIALFYAGGVHPTIVGVVVGLLLPVGLGGRLERALVPWTTLVVVPVFALANAGVRLEGVTDGGVALAVAAGLVVGKFTGVLGSTWLAVRLRLGRLPEGASWRQVAGIAALAGIGFTVSLFIADLAFDDPSSAKVGIIAGSAVAAALGTALLWRGAEDRAS